MLLIFIMMQPSARNPRAIRAYDKVGFDATPASPEEIESEWSGVDHHDNRWIILSEHYYDEKDKLEKTLDIGIDLQRKEIYQFRLTKCLYDHKELSGLLKQTSLKELGSFGDWDGSPVSENSPSLLIIARREF
ncbi:hypothetical protein ACFLZG_03975 [Thermodesulfobacteriota bacterium]